MEGDSFNKAEAWSRQPIRLPKLSRKSLFIQIGGQPVLLNSRSKGTKSLVH